MHRMPLGPGVVLVAVILWGLLVPGFAVAGTWRVELDGSGDFTVIQDAVDAAAPGDTILVGPGRFETVRPIPFWDGFNATVALQKGGLVLQGSGTEQTIIGAGSTYWDYRAIVAENNPSIVYSFTVRDIAIVGGYTGIHYEGDGLLVERCEFANSFDGVAIFTSDNNRVCDSVFHDLGIGIDSFMGNDILIVSGCRFEQMECGVSMQTVTGGIVRDCVFRECIGGIQYDRSSGEITACQVHGIEGTEYGSGVFLELDSVVTMSNCLVDMSTSSPQAALYVRNGSVLSGSDNVIRGGGGTSMRVAGRGRCDNFHGNEIYKAENYCLEAEYYNPSLYGPLVELDMTDNYWGTDIADSISSWIDDADDHPRSPNYWMTVVFQPFEDESVPVTQKSFSDVKNLFR